MALVVVTPEITRPGQQLTVVGIDFANTTECVISCDAVGAAGEAATDSTGQVSGAALADHAKATLTQSVGNVADGDTVTVGSKTYTFKTTLTATGVANEVLIGGTASASLDNLKAAVNGGSGAGSTYGKGTVANADAVAGAKTATTIVFVARLEGTGGNSLASTEVSANLAFGGATFAGGAAAGARAFRFTPVKEGTYEIKVTDGTNTATAKAQVWASA